jgi:pSer/pThr/pTyr-binding forkhead associated (FHA) protein
LTVGIAVPYIFHQTLRAASGKHSKYIGETVHFTTPDVVKVADTHVPIQVADAASTVKEPVGKNTLEFTSGPKAGETINFGAKTVSIGRAEDNDIVVDDPTVSRHHAKVTYQDGKYTIEDLGSTSGTRVAGKEVTMAKISTGETVKLGNTEVGFNLGGNVIKPSPAQSPNNIEIDNPLKTRVINKPAPSMAWLVVTAGPGIGNTYHLKEGTNPVGRESGNGLSINDQYMSRKHAMLKIEGESVNVFDFGSTGGTKVNGTDISARTLQPNGVIRVGETEIKVVEVDSPRQFDQATMSGKTMVDRKGEHVAALMIISGKDSGKSFMLSEGENSVGRDSNSTVTLTDDSVSREHAMIRCMGGHVSVIDLGSTTGTWADGEKMGGVKVENGDVISMGRSEFTVMSRAPQPVGV